MARWPSSVMLYLIYDRQRYGEINKEIVVDESPFSPSLHQSGQSWHTQLPY